MNKIEKVCLCVFLIGLVGWYHTQSDTIRYIYLVMELVGMGVFIQGGKHL